METNKEKKEGCLAGCLGVSLGCGGMILVSLFLLLFLLIVCIAGLCILVAQGII